MTPKQKSLVLITVDSLRADHCGFHGYPRPTTPFLDALTAESFVVPSAVAAGAPTYYSLPAIFASRMPLALGRDVIGLAPGESTLATALRDAGYATAAFSAANPYISSRFGYEQGFEVFEDFLDFDQTSSAETGASAPADLRASSTRNKLNQSLKRAAQAIGFGPAYDELYFQYCLRVASSRVTSMSALRRFPTAEAMVDRAISWLRSCERRPFFLWLHLMDPHSPYYPSEEAYRALTRREVSASQARYVNEFWKRSDLPPARLQRKKGSIIELYDAGIRAVDTQVARLVSHLQQLDVWGECAFALTADHGEEFLDHGRRYHAPVNLREEITRVPLMIRDPDSAKRDVTTVPFSHLHLAPTLLDMLDVRAPEDFRGISLGRNLQQGTSWADFAISECVYGCNNPFRGRDRLAARLLSVRSARHKLVMRIEAGSVEEIYDLEADPKEERPLLSGAQKEVRAQLLQAARNHIRKTSHARPATMRLRSRLRDLGMNLQSNAR
ncbi:MAG: sulfatase-like hydrolase/transferase [Terriglobales bacterium]